MKAELMIKYFEDHFALAIHELEAYGQKKNPERLHQFRVNIKKIRSVIKFLRTIETKKKLKDINRSIRTIFWKAGEVRDLQLKLVWLKKSRKYYLIKFCDLENELQKQDAVFRDNIPKYAEELRELMQSSEEETQHITQEQVNGYFGKILLDLKSQFFNDLQPGEWHEVRKKDKQTLYCLNWLEEVNHNRLTKSSLFRQLDTLQETIGHWHDDILLKDWLGEKQAFLSDDKKVVRQFDTVWHALGEDLSSKTKKIRQQFSRVHKMKFISLK